MRDKMCNKLGALDLTLMLPNETGFLYNLGDQV